MEGVIHAAIQYTLLEQSIEWIGDNMNPEDVFSKKDLENWAEANGYEKSE